MVVPLVTGTLEAVYKGCENIYIKNIEVAVRIEVIQKTDLMATAHILRRNIGITGDSITSNLK